MGKNGLGKKLVFAAAAVGAILLVLRIVGGGADGDAGGDAIDRVDTGRSADDREDGTVETGLERVSTDDTDDGTAVEADESAAEAAATADENDEEATEDEVPVETTGGRFDDLDLFDIVAIAGAAFEAGREEYRNRV